MQNLSMQNLLPAHNDQNPFESTSAVLQVQGLSTVLASEAGWVQAVSDVSFAVVPGQTFALVGESGCGKSMTALSIARLLPDSGAVVSGQVLLKEGSGPNHQTVDCLQLTEAQMRRVRGKRIAMIFQDPSASLNPVMTIGQQLLEVLYLHTALRGQESQAYAQEWLARVGLPEPKILMSRYPMQLSGGQKQRVMIAIALCIKPDVLIADEPTTALDVVTQTQILNLLKTLQAEHHMAMVLITHDLKVVKHMAHHVGLMYAGQLVEVASCEAFFANPTHPYAKGLMAALPSSTQRGEALQVLAGQVPSLINPPQTCRFANRCAHVADFCVQQSSVLTMCANPPNAHWVRCIRAGETALQVSIATPVSSIPFAVHQGVADTACQAALSIEELQVSYPEPGGGFMGFGRAQKTILHGISLDVPKGQTIALVGESGSGKTTAARAMLGLLPETAKITGRVLLAGKPLASWPQTGSNSWRAQVQFVFQDPFAALNPRHRVLEILQEPLLHLQANMPPQAMQQQAAAKLLAVGLPEDALWRFPHEFSGGQRQRIAIARALMPNPHWLICDEPTSALDVSVQAQIVNLLQALQCGLGLGIVLITHNMELVRYWADIVWVLQYGRVVEAGTTDCIFNQAKHAYTQSLLSDVLV